MVQRYRAPRREGKLPRVTISLEPASLEELERLALEQERSVSWIAGRAIRFYLAERRKGSQLILDFERSSNG